MTIVDAQFTDPVQHQHQHPLQEPPPRYFGQGSPPTQFQNGQPPPAQDVFIGMTMMNQMQQSGQPPQQNSLL